MHISLFARSWLGVPSFYQTPRYYLGPGIYCFNITGLLVCLLSQKIKRCILLQLQHIRLPSKLFIVSLLLRHLANVSVMFDDMNIINSLILDSSSFSQAMTAECLYGYMVYYCSICQWYVVVNNDQQLFIGVWFVYSMVRCLGHLLRLLMEWFFQILQSIFAMPRSKWEWRFWQDWLRMKDHTTLVCHFTIVYSAFQWCILKTVQRC